MSGPSRRQWIAGSGAALIGAASLPAGTRAEPRFKFCLNTSTIRNDGKPRPILDAVAIAQNAGYAGIEPCISELDEFEKGGGTLKDLGKGIADAGLEVPNAIGFAEWLVNDPERRKKGLENAKRDMDKALAVGSRKIAAPPTGATGGGSPRDEPKFSEPVGPMRAAERYRDLFDAGKALGVTPIVEVWGFSKSLSRLGETLLCAAE